MEIFFITLGAFGAFIFVMAIGVIIGNRRIQGSCGGPDGCKLCGAGGEEKQEDNPACLRQGRTSTEL